MTPFFMYFRCTRTSLTSLSHYCLLAIKDESCCLVRLVLLSLCSWAKKIVVGHSLEHLPCFGSQRSTVIGLETVSFLLLQQLPLNRRQHIWGLVHEELLVRYICAFSSSTYKPSVAAIKLFSNAVVNVQLSDPYNTCSTHHKDDYPCYFCVDPYEDQFEKKIQAKKERIAKNEYQRLRNIAKNKKIPGEEVT